MQELKINLDDIEITNTEVDKYMQEIEEEGRDIVNGDSENREIIERAVNNELLDNPYSSITAKQMRAIEYRLKGYTKKDISEEIGVSYAMVLKWFKKDETFLTVYDEVKKEVAENNQNKFSNMINPALDRLKRIIEDNATTDKNALAAIKIVLDNADIINTDKDKKVNAPTQIIINNNLLQNPDVREVDNKDQIIVDNAIYEEKEIE